MRHCIIQAGVPIINMTLCHTAQTSCGLLAQRHELLDVGCTVYRPQRSAHMGSSCQSCAGLWSQPESCAMQELLAARKAGASTLAEAEELITQDALQPAQQPQPLGAADAAPQVLLVGTWHQSRPSAAWGPPLLPDRCSLCLLSHPTLWLTR